MWDFLKLKFFISKIFISKIRLHRQVGSPIKDSGNKLEQDVFVKLQDPIEYYHIYGDLFMLSKWNQHYLQLRNYSGSWRCIQTWLSCVLLRVLLREKNSKLNLRLNFSKLHKSQCYLNLSREKVNEGELLCSFLVEIIGIQTRMCYALAMIFVSLSMTTNLHQMSRSNLVQVE